MQPTKQVSLWQPARRIAVAIVILFWLAVLSAWIHDFIVNFNTAIDWMSAQKWMLLAFVLLCAGDDITTEIALRQTQGQGELNPFVNSLFKRKHGRVIAHVLKLLAIIIIIIVLSPSQDNKTLLFLTILFGLVVINNLRSIATYWLSPEYSTGTRAVPTNKKVYALRIAELFAIAAFFTYGMPYIV